MAIKIYVAASSQHVGKTTSTLGLVSALKKRGYQVGYCKPVGQQAVLFGGLLADKDAQLFANTMQFSLAPELHSPVILGKGATTDFLDHPLRFQYEASILHASHQLEAANDVVVYEGTGHPGVGSIVNLSNADVAKLVDARVVVVVEGGIGSTIDVLNMSLALFRERQVKIAGVIINKTLPEKIDKVRQYVGQWLGAKGIPLLGILPFDETLANPTMDMICSAVHGRVVANEQSLDNKVEHIASGSLIEESDYQVQPHTLIIVNYRRLDQAFDAIRETLNNAEEAQNLISGIVVHGEQSAIQHLRSADFQCYTFLEKARIPLIATTLDTYGSAVRISHLEVKINTRTLWKVQRAIELMEQNVRIDALLD